jgi:hypothetical protein
MKAYRQGMGYVSDLPGHVGTKRVKVGSERNSDWGFTNDSAKAIDLSPYWQRRFTKYIRDVQAIGKLY